MIRYLITIQYLGKKFSGFQAQKDNSVVTVQGEIEKAIKEVFKKNITIFASGRLDRGVNAVALMAHFDVEDTVPEYKLIGAINNYLPKEIRIIALKKVANDFHARYMVKQKTYRYSMYVSNCELPLLGERAIRLFKQPNLKAMKKASKVFLGKHDFSAFMSKNSSIKTTVRTIKFIKFKQINNNITMDICGDGFLYNMVRIIVGTLLDVGYSKTTIKQLKNILESKQRKNAGKMVEGYGLQLLNIEY